MLKNRLAALDALRGIAAVGVAIAHFYYNFGFNVTFPAPVLVMQHLGYLVELFFLISAFTMMYTYDHNAANRIAFFFLIKRYFRIAPLFYFCIAINLLIYTWSYPQLPFPFDTTSIVSNAFLLFNLVPQSAFSMTPAGWTIGVEIIFYLLFPLIAIYARRAWVMAALFIAFSVLAYLSKYVLPASSLVDPGSAGYFINLCALNFMPVFIVGIFVYNLWNYVCSDIDSAVRSRIGSICMYVFLALMVPILWMVFPENYLHYIWAGAYLFLMMSVLLKSNWVIVNRITTYLGKISYSIYLLHNLVIGVLLKLLTLGFLSGVENQIVRASVLFLIWSSALVLLSALTYRFLEAPFNRFAVVLINRMQKSRLRTRPLDGDPYRPVVVEHIGGIESR